MCSQYKYCLKLAKIKMWRRWLLRLIFIKQQRNVLWMSCLPRKSKSAPIISKIEHAVICTNSVVTRGLRFLKLFYLHKYDNLRDDECLPIIDRTFVMNCFRAVMGTTASRSFKHRDARELLVDFFSGTLPSAHPYQWPNTLCLCE